MNLDKNGKLIKQLRLNNNLTQKQLAEKIGVLPETVSKWETGRGFPDISIVPLLASALNVTENTLICGEFNKNSTVSANLNKLKFFFCPHCKNIVYSLGDSQVFCCGKQLLPLQVQRSDSEHQLSISTVEDELFIQSAHSMEKEHYVSFIAMIKANQVIITKLYPEQSLQVRLPFIRKSKLYFFCVEHGLFVQDV